MKRRLSDSITRAEQVARREELETPSTADDVQCFDPEPAAFDATPTPFELELNSLEDVFDIGADTWDKIALTKAELGRLGCNLLIDSFVKDFSSTLPSTSPHSDRLQQVSSSLASLLVLDPFPPASEFSPRVRALLSILSHLRDRPASRTIVIVDKKRDAKLLPWILLHADALRDWVVPECLFRTKKRRKAGTETNEASSSPSIHSPSLTIYFLSPGKSLDAFRAGNVNVLFATSNIAKALDVSACDLVVQFDGADGCVLAARFLDAGIRLVTLVETTNAGDASMDAEQDGPDIEPHPSPSARSTAPPFNLAQAAFLLDRFCSRLPRDPYASPPRPSFTLTPTPSGFLASVLLPIISALGPSPRRFGGTTSATKRRAKQAAAFAACEALQQAGALDDLRADEPVDDDEVGPADVLDRHEMVEVEFDNIWGNVLAKDSPVWLNTLEVCEPGAALVVVGLVAGSSLGLYEGGAGNREGGGNGGTSVRLVSCVELSFVNPAEQAVRLEGLRALNFECVKTAVNRRVDDAPFYALFAPLTTDGSIDWTTVSNAFAPTTSATLLPSCIVAISSRRVEHRLYTFKSIRTDVSSLSPIREIEVDLESRLSANELAKFDSYVKFLRIKYSVVISDTEAEEILELESVDTTIPSHLRPRPSPQPSFRRHFPLSLCRTTSLPSSFWRIILVSPFLLRTLHDEIRARRAIAHLDLPPIHIPLLIQALTPPGAVIDFDYENLETLGGSLLQLFTSVHLYLSHPYSTEGGLSTLRRHLISNAFLQQRTLAIGLAPFLLPERFRLATWVPPESDQCDLAPDGLRTKRMIPRRALSDCVESVLAAGFLSGGVRMALMVGGRLGLEVGGEWEGRVPRVANDLERGEGMERLEEVVGYRFECPRLLRQALTHRGVMGAPTNCYEREEFLGDALLDFFVSNHLWTTFPGISSQNLTSLRTRLVSNAALAFVAIRTIEVHRNLIHDSKGLQLAIDEAVVQAKGMSWEDFDDVTWLWDPPKVLGDLVESLLGAIFVDSGCKIDTVLAAATAIFVDVLPLLKNEAPRDPISRLKMHVQSLNCQQTTLSTTPRTSSLPPSASYRYHKYPLFTASHSSQAVAGQLAARGALAVLESPAFDELKARCDCSSKRKADVFLKELKEFKKARMAVVEEPGREGAGREAEGESSGIDSDTDGEEELIVSRVSNLSARGVSSV